MRRSWCDRTAVLEPNRYRIFFNNELAPPYIRRQVLRRTFDTWGQESQDIISRLRIGIVGLGSVGCIVAEAIARIGIADVILVDPDEVEEHNLDRLLYANTNDIGKRKVDLARDTMTSNSTAEAIQIETHPLPVQQKTAYDAMVDCDLVFSCVDRPVARDVLNYIAHAHLIPVIDGGVAVETDLMSDTLFSAHWRSHLITPYHQCMRCNQQYTTSMVITELDGSLDDPSYVGRLPRQDRQRNQNVFPFSLSLAAMEVNMMLRFVLAKDWWPLVRQQDYQFVAGQLQVFNRDCQAACTFRKRRAAGDSESPFYLISVEPSSSTLQPRLNWRRVAKAIGKVFRIS